MLKLSPNWLNCPDVQRLMVVAPSITKEDEAISSEEKISENWLPMGRFSMSSIFPDEVRANLRSTTKACEFVRAALLPEYEIISNP